MTRDLDELAKAMYIAFAAGDRDTVERLLADDFEFHSPPDLQLDRAGCAIATCHGQS